MNTACRRLLVAALLLVLSACKSTRLALVDDSFGFEHVVADRAAHLESPRAILTPAPGGASDAEALTSHRFSLRLRMHNRRAEAWEVRAADFHAEIMPCGEERCSDASIAVDSTSTQLISVAADSTATLDLPLVLHSRGDLRRLERFPIEVRYQDGGGVLLHKRLLLGEFHQGWQTLRFSTVLTSALLAAFLL